MKREPMIEVKPRPRVNRGGQLRGAPADAEPRVVYPPALPPLGGRPTGIGIYMNDYDCYETAVLFGPPIQRMVSVMNWIYRKLPGAAANIDFADAAWAGAWTHYEALRSLYDPDVEWEAVIGRLWATYNPTVAPPMPTELTTAAVVTLPIVAGIDSAGVAVAVPAANELPTYVSASMAETGNNGGRLVRGGHRFWIQNETHVDGSFIALGFQAPWTAMNARFHTAVVFEGTDPAPLQYAQLGIFRKKAYNAAIKVPGAPLTRPSTYVAPVGQWSINTYVGSQVSRKYRPE